MPPFAYTFPTIRGLQAGRAYYVTMCPLRLIPRIFLFDEEELAPELRAQRSLNKARVPEIARYISNNRDSYVFSSLTASIDGEVTFEPMRDGEGYRDIGILHVPLNAKFIVNDGQHRRAGIEMALREHPEMGDETISVVFFVDPGVGRAQQMFTDLNRYAVRPSRSLGVLYDQREDHSVLPSNDVKKSKFFPGLVEFERSTLAPRSSRLFTLSAIETANNILLGEQPQPIADRIAVAVAFWDEVAVHIPEWQDVKNRKLTAGDVRRDSVAAHGIVLSALAHAGRALMTTDPKGWKKRLSALEKLNWSRANAALWEGRAMVAGKLSKNHHHVRLTALALKQRLGLPLTPEDQQLEQVMKAGEAR